MKIGSVMIFIFLFCFSQLQADDIQQEITLKKIEVYFSYLGKPISPKYHSLGGGFYGLSGIDDLGVENIILLAPRGRIELIHVGSRYKNPAAFAYWLLGFGLVESIGFERIDNRTGAIIYRKGDNVIAIKDMTNSGDEFYSGRVSFLKRELLDQIR
jgi:hypothetical protein